MDDPKAAYKDLKKRTDQWIEEHPEVPVVDVVPLTKQQWIERYGGKQLLDAEGFDVVPCDPETCDDKICHGWRVQRNPSPVVPVEDDEDPTPWCSHCEAKRRAQCHCGPLADND